MNRCGNSFYFYVLLILFFLYGVDVFRCVQNREIVVELFANLSLSMEVPEVSEDCLYLNIYTPAKPGEDARLPVSHKPLFTFLHTYQ